MAAPSSDKNPYRWLMVRLRNVLLWCCLLGLSLLSCILLPFDRKRMLYKRLTQLGSRGMLRIAGITLEVRGREYLNLSVPSVYVSNHSSMMDMVCLIAGVSAEIAFVYKQDMHSIPLFGWALRYGRVHFPIHRNKDAIAAVQLQNVIEGVRKGRSVLVFAEGTRTRDGQIHQFKNGAFYIALKAHVPVVPITVSGTYNVLPSTSRCVQPGAVRITIGEPVLYYAGDSNLGRDELKEIVFQRIKRNYVPEIAEPQH